MNLVNQIKGQIFYGAILSLIVLVFGAGQAHAAGVSLSAVPTSQTVMVGQTANYTIKINRDNYTDKVTLSAIGLPAGVTASFTPNTTTAISSTLKLQTAANTPIGTFNITVKGTGFGITIAPITVQLIITPLQAISVSVLPEAQSIIAGQTTYYDITINRTGFSGAVRLSAENVPSGIEVAFEPQVTTGNTARAWIYSSGLWQLPASFQMNIVAARNDFPNLRGLKLIKLNVNCDILWTDQGYVEQNGSPDFATAITSDSAKNVYAAGHFITNNATEIWVAKYSPNGARIWLRNITLNNVAGLDKRARAIAVDTTDNIYVAGSTRTGMQQVNYDIFIAKFDGNGNQLGNNVFGNNRAEDGGGGMELGFDSNGYAVLTAVMNVRRTNINDGFGGTVVHAFYDINRMTFDSSLGTFPLRLVQDIIGDPKDLAVGSNGSIYVVGRELNFNTVEYFGWARKYNSNGGQTYNQSFAADFFPSRVAADSSGNAFVAGNIYRTTGGDFSYDVWLAKLATNGSQQWVNFDATPDTEIIGDLTTDASGNVIYTGTTTGNLAATNPDGNTDIWLAKRSGSGVPFFVRQFAVDNKDGFEAIALDNAGNALLAGNTVVFKGTNYGSEDVFLMKYSLSSSNIRSFITRLTPSSVRGGTQFTIEGGNFFGFTGIYFDGQPLNFTIVSFNRITATAPTVTTAKTGNLTLSDNCYQYNSPIQLTVTP